MGDIERAFAHSKTKTPARGVPIEMPADDDLTPPPQMPPSSEDVDIEAVLREHTEAIARVWESRDLRDSVVTIGKDVAQLTALTREFLLPVVKNVQGRIGNIEQASEANRGKQDRFWEHEWPTALKTLELIGGHMGRIEKDVDRVERTLDAFIKRSDAQVAQLMAEIAELKSSDSDKSVRIRQLEDFVLTVKAKVGLVSALVGSGGAGAAMVIKYLVGGG